jgi:SAM-dependent methyltransferase
MLPLCATVGSVLKGCMSNIPPDYWGGDEGEAKQVDLRYRSSANSPPMDVAAAYNEAAEFYDEWKWQQVWSIVEWPYIYSIVREHGLPLDARILDIGTGTGNYLKRLVENFSVFRSCGIDISRHMLKRADQKLVGRADLKRGTAQELFFQDGYFDVVLLCRVGSHIKDIAPVTREISRVLRAGGIAIVCDLDPSFPYDLTRVPCGSGKVAVETHKHHASSWLREFELLGLKIQSMREIMANQVRERLSGDLPHSLVRAVGPLSFLVVASKP